MFHIIIYNQKTKYEEIIYTSYQQGSLKRMMSIIRQSYCNLYLIQLVLHKKGYNKIIAQQ